MTGRTAKMWVGGWGWGRALARHWRAGAGADLDEDEDLGGAGYTEAFPRGGVTAVLDANGSIALPTEAMLTFDVRVRVARVRREMGRGRAARRGAQGSTR